MGLLDDVTIPAQCAKCGHTVEKAIIWLKNNQPFPCAACGAPVSVDGMEEVGAAFELVNKKAASSEVTIPKKP